MGERGGQSLVGIGSAFLRIFLVQTQLAFKIFDWRIRAQVHRQRRCTGLSAVLPSLSQHVCKSAGRLGARSPSRVADTAFGPTYVHRSRIRQAPGTLQGGQKSSQNTIASIETTPDASDDVVAAVIDLLAKKDALDDKFDSKTLRIVHFNDVYNLTPRTTIREGEVKPYGGFTRFAKALKDFQAAGPKAMVVFSGDFVGPSLASAITQGTHVLAALNYLDVHYGTWGNHEFDFGIQKLKDIIAGVVDEGEPDHGASKTTWIASNMNGADGQPLAGAEKKVLVDWEGVKVGIIGVSQNWLPGCAKIHEGEAEYIDFIEEANRLCKELRKEGGCPADSFGNCKGPDRVYCRCRGHTSGDTQSAGQRQEVRQGSAGRRPGPGRARPLPVPRP
eukprot:scaffold1640_cov200-Pinguiococcus_pyrenoidosus.AAC.1